MDSANKYLVGELPKNSIYGTTHYQYVVLVIEPKNSHPRLVGNDEILLRNLAIWFAMIAAGGLMSILLEKLFGIGQNRISTSFFNMVIVFFGGGILKWKYTFQGVFLVTMLFAAFFFNSIFSGVLFDSYTSESGFRINTFEKLSKTNFTYFYDEPLRHRVSAIQQTMKYILDFHQTFFI